MVKEAEGTSQLPINLQDHAEEQDDYSRCYWSSPKKRAEASRAQRRINRLSEDARERRFTPADQLLGLPRMSVNTIEIMRETTAITLEIIRKIEEGK